nr:PREDICTED: uncharacterized protein LOC102347430 [Latimeria chalumnae]|eukprot:XP_005994743.1 PREDICTED: uncharacterized protein LOC102347430 [Latimeria chalumnae]
MSLQKHYDHMSDNTKKLETTLLQINSKFDKLTSRITQVENRVEKAEQQIKETEVQLKSCEDSSAQNLHLAKSLVKENKSLKRHLELAENQLRGASLHILGLPEGEAQKDLIQFLEQWIPKTLKLTGEEADIRIERAYRAPTKKGTNTESRRTTVVKLSSERDRDGILMAARRMKEITYEGQKVLFFPDLSNKMQTRALSEIKKELLDLNINAALLYPAKLRVEYDDKTYLFWDPIDAERFAYGKKRIPSKTPPEILEDTDSD